MSSREDLAVRAAQPAEEALRLHPFYRGKVQVLPKCPIRDFHEFAIWYTPGVAAASRAVERQPDLVWGHTNRGNLVAIVSDGTRVLGLGNIGPEAALPVMEGKALLFKYLGGVDAVPICLGTTEPKEIIQAVKWLQPRFGGVNMEDIAQPKCFEVLDQLRSELAIPVWHDDQQGTAMVLLAGLLNALKLVGKPLDRARIGMIGAGAANIATYRTLRASGVPAEAIIVCDSQGILHRGRSDIVRRQAEFKDKWHICSETNPDQLVGGIRETLHGADVCIAFSRPGPDVISPEAIKAMAKDAIVFACANPVPEIWPWDAAAAGARIVATGRSDFPNQVNNSLGFPGLFRGVLDVRARRITDAMSMAAARELASLAAERGLREDAILPSMDDTAVAVREAVAVGMMAQQEGVAGLSRTREQLKLAAEEAISSARQATQVLMRERLIKPVPAAE
ncbi:MAG: NADP-dependent malic enzyme [Acidobacteria bacterium]|nr:NADP-dependent malic enzyme [Acidobacteriota bacterium]